MLWGSLCLIGGENNEIISVAWLKVRLHLSARFPAAGGSVMPFYLSAVNKSWTKPPSSVIRVSIGQSWNIHGGPITMCSSLFIAAYNLKTLSWGVSQHIQPGRNIPSSVSVGHVGKEESTESRSYSTGILQRGCATAQRALRQSPPWGGGFPGPGQEGRECSSVPNFLTPTQTHNRSAGPRGTERGMKRQQHAAFFVRAEQNIFFFVSLMAQQNDLVMCFNSAISPYNLFYAVQKTI